MRSIISFTLIALVAACNTTTDPAPGETPAATAADPLIGKTLTGPQATFIFNADGTVGGSFRDDPIVGVYTASATEVCSTYSAPANFADLGEICSKPAISGDQVVFNRRDGSTSPTYSIGG